MADFSKFDEKAKETWTVEFVRRTIVELFESRDEHDVPRGYNIVFVIDEKDARLFGDIRDITEQCGGVLEFYKAPM
jgi:hypothetical protein